MRLAVVLLVLLAGCAGAPPGDAPSPGAAACDRETQAPLTNGGCASIVGAPDLRDREPSLAAHPTDPATLLLTWRQGEFSEGPRIFAALSRDASATWDVAQLEHRGRDPPLGEGTYAYDSIAAFGPDGTAYVMYAGDRTTIEAGRYYLDRLTLARSADGLAWSYATIGESPSGASAPDYPDLAVAPDTGRLHVVAQVYGIPPIAVAFAPEGIWHWTSDDGGATWSAPQVIIPTALPFHIAPRVAAGPDGLVVVATTAGGTGHVTISRDGGETFDAPRATLPYEGAINDPVAIDGARIALLYADGDRIVGLRSEDAGATWGEPEELATLPHPIAYLSAAQAPGGPVAMAKHGTEDALGISLVAWRDPARVHVVHEAEAPGAWSVGDDYGALAVGADAAAWVAWAMPPGEGEDVWVARVPDA